MKNLASAIIAVMKDVKGIEKTLKVGSGNGQYMGVSDQEVKKVVGESMQRNGLCILPIDIQENTQIDRWEEESFYNGVSNGTKMKQSVFTKVTTKYLLIHESGESIEIVGYGHGIDSQDKGAGKATTYALKYALLYTFLIPTGKIDDADADHSDNKDTPKNSPKNTQADDNRPWLNEGTKEFAGAVKKLKAGTTTIDKIRIAMKISKAVEQKLLSESNN